MAEYKKKEEQFSYMDNIKGQWFTNKQKDN